MANELYHLVRALLDPDTTKGRAKRVRFHNDPETEMQGLDLARKQALFTMDRAFICHYLLTADYVSGGPVSKSDYEALVEDILDYDMAKDGTWPDPGSDGDWGSAFDPLAGQAAWPDPAPGARKLDPKTAPAQANQRIQVIGEGLLDSCSIVLREENNTANEMSQKITRFESKTYRTRRVSAEFDLTGQASGRRFAVYVYNAPWQRFRVRNAYLTIA